MTRPTIDCCCRSSNRWTDDRRTARFACVLALSEPDGRIVLTVADAMEGRLLRVPRGDNGFGYDPLFVPDGHDRTSAEMAPVDKGRISHRGKALGHLRALMVEQGLLG